MFAPYDSLINVIAHKLDGMKCVLRMYISSWDSFTFKIIWDFEHLAISDIQILKNEQFYFFALFPYDRWICQQSAALQLT